MSKTEEINLLQKKIADAPRGSYLRDTLSHIAVQFEADIRSDFSTLPSMAEIETASLNALAIQKTILADNATLRERNDLLEQQIHFHKRKLMELRATFQEITQSLHDLTNRTLSPDRISKL